MKKLGLILASLIFLSCYENEQKKKELEKKWKDYDVLVIDSCEYIIRSSGDSYRGFGYMAHKGNCKFCKERR